MTDFDEKELKDAARQFMTNMQCNADRIRLLSGEDELAYQYFTSVCRNDFENQIFYGMAIGNDYEIPEEYR